MEFLHVQLILNYLKANKRKASFAAGSLVLLVAGRWLWGGNSYLAWSRVFTDTLIGLAIGSMVIIGAFGLVAVIYKISRPLPVKVVIFRLLVLCAGCRALLFAIGKIEELIRQAVSTYHYTGGIPVYVQNIPMEWLLFILFEPAYTLVILLGLAGLALALRKKRLGIRPVISVIIPLAAWSLIARTVAEIIALPLVLLLAYASPSFVDWLIFDSPFGALLFALSAAIFSLQFLWLAIVALALLDKQEKDEGLIPA